MSEYKLKKIVAPQLNEQPYGQNLKEQFDAINTNFKLLANHDFIKGDKGNSVRAVFTTLYDTQDGLTAIGANVIEALLADALGQGVWANYKESWDKISSKTISNINAWTITNAITQLMPAKVDGQDISFMDNIIGITLTLIQVFDPSETNPIYTNVAFANSIALRDNRFVGAALSQDDLASYSDKVDVSGTVTLTVVDNDNYTITVLHDFPTLYYDGDVFRWKIGGRETGIIAQGPAGSNGKDGTIYMVKVSDTHPTEADKSTWYKIESVWDRTTSSWKPDPDEIVNDYIQAGETCVAFLSEATTEAGGETSSKIYITTVVSSGDVLYAVCNSTKQIKFEAGLDIVEKFMNKLPNLDDNWLGLHVRDTLTEQDDQPFYQHMIRSTSEPDNQEANKNGDLNIEPTNMRSDDLTSPTYDPTARLNLKYNRVRLGFDNVKAFDGDIRDSQIVAYLYSTYTDGIRNYWDRSSLSMYKKSYWSDSNSLTSLTNISHEWSGGPLYDDDTDLRHVLNIGAGYLTISPAGEWDFTKKATMMSIRTDSDTASLSVVERGVWCRGGSEKRNFVVNCATLKIGSEYLTTSDLMLKATMGDIYLGTDSRNANGYLNNCRLHSGSSQSPYLELINSNFFIENSNEINSYNLNTTNESYSGDILLNFSPLPSNPTMGGKLPKKDGVLWFTKYPGKVQIGSDSRKSNLEVFGQSKLRGGLTVPDTFNISRNLTITGRDTDIYQNIDRLTASAAHGTDVTLTSGEVFGDAMTIKNNYILYGKGIIYFKVEGNDGPTDTHDVIITSIPDRSFFHIKFIVNNTGNKAADNVRLYIGLKSSDSRNLALDIKVGKNSSEIVEYAGFTTTGGQLASSGKTINK